MVHDVIKILIITFLGSMGVYAMYLDNFAFTGTIVAGFLALLNFETRYGNNEKPIVETDKKETL